MKTNDWIGNKNSCRAALGISKNGYMFDRAIGDYYATDPEALRAFLNVVNFDWAGHTVWECACGSGNLSKVLESVPGLNVFSSDLYNRGYGRSYIDFLKSGIPDGVDIILTNPPYKYAVQFIEHALDILPMDGYCIMLLPVTYLAGKERYDKLFSKGWLQTVWVFSGRFYVWKNNVQTTMKSMQQYAWFVFSKRWCLEPTINWIR